MERINANDMTGPADQTYLAALTDVTSNPPKLPHSPPLKTNGHTDSEPHHRFLRIRHH